MWLALPAFLAALVASVGCPAHDDPERASTPGDTQVETGAPPEGDADTGTPAETPDTGEPGDSGDTGDPADTSDTGGPLGASDWCGVQAILDASCTSCHSVGGGLEAALDLQVDAWTNLVGQPSAIFADEILVVAGASASSLLYRKLAGTQGSSGSQMPYGGPYLDAETIAVVEAWIDAGAPGACGGGQDTADTDTGSGSDTAIIDTGDRPTGDTAGGIDTALADTAGDTGLGDTGSAGPWDLDLTGAAWSSHVGDTLYLNVVRDGDAVVVATATTEIASGEPTFSFAGVLAAGESYTLDYFADENANGTCESYPTDHVFHQSIGTPGGDMAVTMTHSGALLDNDGCDSF